MPPDQAAILSWLSERGEAMTALLSELVGIDSGSADKPGVDRVGERLGAFMATHSVSMTRTPLESVGDLMRFGREDFGPRANRRTVLLMGHRDTVFGPGEAARRPFQVRNGRAYGPGVADMKGGLVMNAFVLAAFARLAPQVPLIFLTTGDEEIGSAVSRPFIEAEAASARAAFNAEPARQSGAIVTERKGGFTYRIQVEGKASHSGVAFGDGASAISDLARKIVALDGLTDQDQGVTLNVGLVSGGSSVNTVAAGAEADLDVRFVTRSQREDLIRRIEAILSSPLVPGTRTTFTRESESLPLVSSSENKALSGLYLGVARDLGFEVGAEFTGGCADSGITAWAGAPTICGTGPVGGRAHTEVEYIELATLCERSRVLASTICRLVV